MTMFLKEPCQKCQEPTKYVEGFATLTHGRQIKVFACKNENCETYKLNKDIGRSINEKHVRIAKENEESGVNVRALREVRLQSCILIGQIAAHLKIGSAEYSLYESGAKAMPKELYTRAMSFLFENTAV